MSSYTGLCHENGCVCAKCFYRHNYKSGPEDCHGGGCTDCIPELKKEEEEKAVNSMATLLIGCLDDPRNKDVIDFLINNATTTDN